MFGLPMRLPKNAWLLNCCVSPQSEIARVRIDRSLIGTPSNFQHIGHLGADDLSSTVDDNNALVLLSSKGSPDYAMAVPRGLREADVPVRQPEMERAGKEDPAKEDETIVATAGRTANQLLTDCWPTTARR